MFIRSLKLRTKLSHMSQFSHPFSNFVHLQRSHMVVWTAVVRVAKIAWKSTRLSPKQHQNCSHVSRFNAVDAPAGSDMQGPCRYLHGVERLQPPTCPYPPLQPPPKNVCVRKLCSRVWQADVLQCRVEQNKTRRHCHMFHHHDKDGLQLYVPFLRVILEPLKLTLLWKQNVDFIRGSFVKILTK